MKKRKNRSYYRRKGEINRSTSRIAKESNSIQDEIEEQLERQRRKRALECPDSTSQKTDPLVLGNYEYDSVTKAYFPKQSTGRVSHEKDEQGNEDNIYHATKGQLHSHNFGLYDHHVPVYRFRTSALAHIAELNSNSARCRDLRVHWAGRIVLNNMQVESSARRTVDSHQRHISWALMFPQLKRSPHQGDRSESEMEIPWDLGCKISLHSSSRTFDVQQGADHSTLPDIATLVDGGTFIRLGQANPRVWNEPNNMSLLGPRNTSFEADSGNVMLRFAPRDSNNFPNIARLNNRRPGKMEMVNVQPTQSSSLRVDVSCCDCNDVAFHPLFGKGNFEIAVAPRITQNTTHVTLHRDIQSGTSFDMRTSLFSKSDTLCVEYLNDRIILFGHRNGSISLFDKRCEHITNAASAQVQGGSTTSILPLRNEYMFLAKKSFGSCYLFDIRKMSEKNESTIVWHLQPPTDTISTLSFSCSGVAVDPTQTIAISPFADSRRRGHFAVWSLINGSLLGSKSCQISSSNMVDCQSRICMPHCELRSGITPSWKFETQGDGSIAIRKKCNSWSLWFKSGEVNPLAPNCAGSIHQLIFRGRPDEFGFGNQIGSVQSYP